MINLIKMETLRLFKSRGTYIAMVVLMLMSLMFIGMDCFVGNFTVETEGVEGTSELSEDEFEQLEVEQEESESNDLSEDETDDGLVLGFSVGGYSRNSDVSFTDFLAEILSSGIFLMFTGIIAAGMVCNRYKSGFQKNLSIYSQRKWKIALAVNFPILVFSAIVILVETLIHFVFYALYFEQFSLGGAGTLISYLLMQILLNYAFTALIICLAELTRSKAACVTITCLLAMGTGVNISSLLDSILKWDSFSLTEHSLVYCLRTLPTSFDRGTWLVAIAVALLWIVVYNAISAAIVSNRDMA